MLVPFLSSGIETLDISEAFPYSTNVNFLNHIAGTSTITYQYSINALKIRNLIHWTGTFKTNTHWGTRKHNNKIQHTINGNYHLNILHWNKGNTHFKNKITHIDQILDEF